MSSGWKNLGSDPVSSFLTARQSGSNAVNNISSSLLDAFGNVSRTVTSAVDAKMNQPTVETLMKILLDFPDGADAADISKKLNCSIGAIPELLEKAKAIGVISSNVEDNRLLFHITSVGKKIFEPKDAQV